MLTEDRYAGILEFVNRQGSASLSELCTLLNASESTVRRDLNHLDEKGVLRKVRGGAVAVTETRSKMKADQTEEEEKTYIEEKAHIEETNIAAEEVIAKYAASLIEDNDCVFLDTGSTTEKMIAYLSDKKAVFVTNTFIQARKLAQKGLRVFIPAGEVIAETEVIVGASCVLMLEEYNFTKCFLDVNGISLTAGFTVSDKSEADIKRAAAANSRTVYFLADHSKFDHTAAVTFAPLTAGTIITDTVSNKIYQTEAAIKEVCK
ncbi:MAG: DeoR/GlpR transcriptional regulator [Ruminococcus sp.]|nr:DeoR/GlpR transcriptional regulator [Ruminococcus sp.]